MRIAIIPARGGSKRIPRKNIKEFHGKPMIAYSIEAALQSNCFDKIIVSTDDIEIADIAKEYGAEVPFIRPVALADDHTGTVSVVQHAISFLEESGFQCTDIFCLYATAPFVQSRIIIESYEQLKRNEADYCLAVTQFASPIQRALKITDKNCLEMFYPEYLSRRSQDLRESYHDAGQFIWGKAAAFKSEEILFSLSVTPYVLPKYLVQDIDEPEDWKRAELLYQVLKKNGDIA